jgi:transcriptional regulator with XRE-family HTH domain
MNENCIKEIRKKRKLTQTQLAKLLGVSQGAIQMLETGQRGLDLDWINKIAKALNCEPWELLPKEMQPDISPDEMEIIRAVRKSKEVVAKINEVSSTNKAS